MEVEVTPEPEDDERQALLSALAPPADRPPARASYESPWRRAGLDEAVEAWRLGTRNRSSRSTVARARCAVAAESIQPARTMSLSARSA